MHAIFHKRQICDFDGAPGRWQMLTMWQLAMREDRSYHRTISLASPGDCRPAASAGFAISGSGLRASRKSGPYTREIPHVPRACYIIPKAASPVDGPGQGRQPVPVNGKIAMRWWLWVGAGIVFIWSAGDGLAQSSRSYGSRPPCSAVTPSPFAGAARGAARGAIVGGIFGNAGRSAAIGAGVRGVSAMARRGSARSAGSCY